MPAASSSSGRYIMPSSVKLLPTPRIRSVSGRTGNGKLGASGCARGVSTASRANAQSAKRNSFFMPLSDLEVKKPSFRREDGP